MIRKGMRSRREPVPAITMTGYIYIVAGEHVPAVRREHVPGIRRESVPAGTRSRRAPVPAVPREPVPGEHAPAACNGGGVKAGGAWGMVVRTSGYLSFSRRGSLQKKV